METLLSREKRAPISVDERLLTEVRHLAANRLPDGTYPTEVRRDVLVNLKTAVQEAGIPHAISTTEHTYERVSDNLGLFRWMGKTAVENAMSGYAFHVSEAARQRVDVEVDEAYHAQEDLRPGVMKFFISPRMSMDDASEEVAKQEHLANDDALRASWLVTDEAGNIEKRILQSILVRDVPLEAWVSMLQDSNNIFGKAILVDNPDSALSVMKVHRELELPLGMVPDGPVGLVRAVLPYITDPKLYESVAKQINRFEEDQDELDFQAERIAERWLKFEENLEKSLHNKIANPIIKSFIYTFQDQWNRAALDLLKEHEDGSGYRMSDELAYMLEEARRNTLWVSAAVLSGNEIVINQMDHTTVHDIRSNELEIQRLQQIGEHAHQLEARNNQAIAQHNIEVGGGCSGSSQGKFGDPNSPGFKESESKDWKNDPKSWKQGVCRIKSCHTRPGMTKVGPCDVCASCQAAFDSGQDPSKQKLRKRVESVISNLAFNLFSNKKEKQPVAT